MAATADSTNVTRLPTAAPRKVRQNFNRAARAARGALPQFTGEYVLPGVRAAMATAEQIVELRRGVTPELELLTALLPTLDDAACATIARTLAIGVVGGRETARQAMAVFRSSRMTVGESFDLYAAMERIGERA